MWKHKNFINLQLCAGPQPFPIAVNGHMVLIGRLSDSMVPGEETWSYNASINTNKYTISGNTVVWNDGTILQYNGVDVVPTDNIIFNGQYTTRTATPTLTFKHFYDAGTIGSGTVKFRHYSQQEPSTSETWVLNETVALPSGNMSAEFQSNNQYFSTIGTGIMYSKNYLSYIDEYNDDTFVYRENTNTWVNEDGTDTTAYRTLIFDTAPTGDLLTWLQANGTKQGGGGGQ